MHLNFLSQRLHHRPRRVDQLQNLHRLTLIMNHQNKLWSRKIGQLRKLLKSKFLMRLSCIEASISEQTSFMREFLLAHVYFSLALGVIKNSDSISQRVFIRWQIAKQFNLYLDQMTESIYRFFPFRNTFYTQKYSIF